MINGCYSRIKSKNQIHLWQMEGALMRSHTEGPEWTHIEAPQYDSQTAKQYK